MKKLKQILLIASVFALATSSGYAQCGGSYDTNGNETPHSQFNPGCSVYNACNGSRYAGWTGTDGTPCYNFDPDYAPLGCDMSCAPIDSGVLFLLLGGGLFGGMMIMRRRESDLTPLVSKD